MLALLKIHRRFQTGADRHQLARQAHSAFNAAGHRRPGGLEISNFCLRIVFRRQ